MNKRTLAIWLICMLFTLLISVHGQKLSSNADKKTQKSNLQRYIDISLLTKSEVPKIFSAFSASEKADLMRLHLSLQLAFRQNLTKEQKDLILEATEMATAEIYNDDAQKRIEGQRNLGMLGQRAKLIFSQQETFEIFGNIKANSEEIKKLQRYEDFSPYDLESRKSTYKSFDALGKANAWDIHLAIFLSQSQMNAYQQAVLLDLMEFVHPQIFEIAMGSQQWENRVDKPLTRILQKAEHLFSKEEKIRLLSELGGSKGKLSLRTENGNSPESPQDECQCHKGSGDLCLYGCEGTNCTRVSGCGYFWLYQCNGVSCAPIPWEQ